MFKISNEHILKYKVVYCSQVVVHTVVHFFFQCCIGYAYFHLLKTDIAAANCQFQLNEKLTYV